MLSGRNSSMYPSGRTSREYHVISKFNRVVQDLERARSAMASLEREKSEILQRQEAERMMESVQNTIFGDDVVATEKEPVCAICLENKCVLASQECGHACLCFACARALIEKGDTKCPTCRVAIRKRLQRVYF